MVDMGLELSAEDIYSINHASLNDIIGALDYGSCTAELISHQGLILTNHHCVEDEIQNHTTAQHDYLRDGFWAKTYEDELPNPGKTISFFVRMENVTERVTGLVHDEMTEQERDESIEKIAREVIHENTEGNHYEGRVVPLFGGNDYYLILMETFRDIRLVGAPPESIGRFGFDTDNWEWPRHNADFSLMRIYTGPDGKPADYAIENIPYRTEKCLPISLEGYKENDLALVIGFPGTTSRYVSADRVKEVVEIDNTNRIRIRGKALELIMENMLADDRVRIKYSAKYSNLSNYYKYSQGQNLCIRNLRVIERREKHEQALQEWIQADSTRIARYGDMMDQISQVVEERKEIENALSYMEEMFLAHKATELIGFAAEGRSLYFLELGYSGDSQNRKELLDELAETGIEFFKDFDPGLDKRIAVEMIALFTENVDPLYYPYFYSDLMGEYEGDIQHFLDDIYKKSFFADEESFQNFLRKPRFRKLNKDPAFQLALSIFSRYISILYEYKELDERMWKAERLYVEATRKMYPDSLFYPDANSTLRLSYGKVKGYKGNDATYYDFITTLSGVMEKEDPSDREFFVPSKLKDLYGEHDYGKWIEQDTMPVCFLTDNDIAGGNSGSPVLNARGEIIGLAFDGNWEAMSGEMIYEKHKQRCINVDIRYILFLMDKYAGAGHLIEEMSILDRD